MQQYRTLTRKTPLRRSSAPLRRKPIEGSRRVAASARVYTGPNAETREAMHRRDYWCCARCGIHAGQARLDPHHRKPRGMGGTSDPDANSLANLVPLCRDCHEEVERDRERAYLDGWLVRRGDDPAKTPVRHFRLSWVLPTPWGAYDNPPVEWVPGQLDLLDQL